MWWARQDSNLQPDRYERPILTIEALRGREDTRPSPDIRGAESSLGGISPNLYGILERNGAPDTIRMCGLRLRRAAVRRADDLLVTAHLRAAFISGGQAQRVAKALRNRSASGTRCTSVDDYELATG